LRGLGWFEHSTAESSEAATSRVAEQVRLRKADDSHSLCVAEDAGGKAVGYASAHWLPCPFLPAPEGYLSELFVDEAYQGKGIGKMLLETIATEARERSCSRLMLLNSRNRESCLRGSFDKQGWAERQGAANFVYKP
jgi:GNAT superfamily N-acetyltransferase